MATKAVKKKKLELPISSDGHFLVQDESHALLALQKAGVLIEEIEEIKREHDLGGKEATYQDLRKALNAYQAENEIEELSDGTFKSLLVERTGTKWIFSEEQLESLPELDTDTEVIPLTRIIEDKFGEKAKKILFKVTSRVFDPAKLDDVVKAGILTAKEVEPAFLSFIQTTYVQVSRKKK